MKYIMSLQEQNTNLLKNMQRIVKCNKVKYDITQYNVRRDNDMMF